MTRLTLRKGFTLQPAPGGLGHLTDTSTGDVLVVSPDDFQVLSAAGNELDPEQPEVAAVLPKYRPFYVAAAGVPASFYELDIEDAPTVPQIPSIAPVTLERPAVEPEAELPTLQPIEDAGLLPEPETKEHVAFSPPPDDEFTQPAGLAEQFLEEQRQLAQQPQHTEEVSAADVAAAIGSASAMGAPSAAPEVAATAPRSSHRPLVLTLAGVTLLAIAVAATFALRPKGETPLPEVPNPTTVVTTVVDAGVPEVVIDAGPLEAPDAGAPEAPDAGVAVPVVPEPVIVDAGAPVAAQEVDAGVAEETEWLSAEVQARGRVKMGEVTANAEGEVSWTVAEEERVKAKQALGSLAREAGEPLPFTAASVGLVIIKQPAGTRVKRGAVLAEIIYFEAWARAAVKGQAPKLNWRCEVSSASLQQKAACKISVVAPKGTGAVVTVAIEPRWFDGATDAVLRFAP